jgi:hypothetical protein
MPNSPGCLRSVSGRAFSPAGCGFHTWDGHHTDVRSNHNPVVAEDAGKMAIHSRRSFCHDRSDRPRNLKESWRQFQTPDRGFTSFWMSALRLADGRPTKHTKHTKRIRGREVVALFSRLTIDKALPAASRVSCVLLAKFHGPVRSVEFATVVLTRRMWLRPSGLDFGRSVSAALPRGWILAAPFPGDSTRGLSSRAWQPAIVS